MDEIIIENLKVFCKHGVEEKEKRDGQNFYITARIFLETHTAGITDNIENTVNYADVCEMMKDFMCNTQYDLLEAVAENLAAKVLNFSPLIRGIDLKISKPEAPIEIPFENISVRVKRFWNKAYISFGSNIGDKMKFLQDAFDKINANSTIRILKMSSIKSTKPYGHIEQDDFLNGVMLIETYLDPQLLLNYLNKLEKEAGRTRDVKWGPRTLDLDIVLFGQEVIHTETLIVPHMDMHNRPFVMEPLCEIAPYAFHPVFNKTVKQLLNEYRNR